MTPEAVLDGVIEASELRLHFNKHGAAPVVWCVSTLHFEIAVKGFRTWVPLETVYSPKDTPDDEDGKPSAWLRPLQSGKVRVRLLDSGWLDISRYTPEAP